MRLPLELFLGNWEAYSERELGELAALVGAEEASVEAAARAASRLRRYYKKTCSVYGPGKLCLYTYTVVESAPFLRHPVLAAMRGTLVYREAGTVVQVGFPFAKFFNYGEVPQTQGLQWSGRVVVTEKVDDTLIVAQRLPDGTLALNTRGMLWNQSPRGYVPPPGRPANPFVDVFLGAVKRLGLSLDDVVKEGRTVMFGLVIEGRPASYASPDWSREQPTQFYDRAVPYLLAWRDMRTLELAYPSPSEAHGFPVPARYEFSSLREAVEWVRSHPEKEGLVIHFPGSSYDARFPWWHYTVKLKNKVYTAQALIAAGGGYRAAGERLLARAVIEGRLDDIVAVYGADSEIAAKARRFAEKYEELVAALDEAAQTLRPIGPPAARWLKGSAPGPVGRTLAWLATGGDPRTAAAKLALHVLSGKPGLDQASHGLERLARRVRETARTAAYALRYSAGSRQAEPA